MERNIDFCLMDWKSWLNSITSERPGCQATFKVVGVYMFIVSRESRFASRTDIAFKDQTLVIPRVLYNIQNKKIFCFCFFNSNHHTELLLSPDMSTGFCNPQSKNFKLYCYVILSQRSGVGQLIKCTLYTVHYMHMFFGQNSCFYTIFKSSVCSFLSLPFNFKNQV